MARKWYKFRFQAVDWIRYIYGQLRKPNDLIDRRDGVYKTRPAVLVQL